MGTASVQVIEPAAPSVATSNSFLYFGMLAGIAGILSIVVDLFTPSASSAQNQLASFQGNPNGYALYLYPLAFAFLVTPFFVYLGSVLRAKGAEVAQSAVLLILLALYSLGIAGAFEYGGYWAASITPAPSHAAQAYQAAFWMNVNDAWEAVSIYGVAMGSLLLAWALRQTRELPKWMSTAAFVGGGIDLAGAIMASLSGYYSALMFGFVLPLVTLIIFIVFSFLIPRTFRRLHAATPASPSAAA
jgi:hypothetical protein